MALNLIEIVSLTLVVLSAIVAVRVLLRLSSLRHRRRYTKIVKYNFLIGTILGFLLPWNEEIGMIAAAASSAILVLFSVIFYILGGSALGLWLFRTVWWPKEKAREWFLNFSITTGVIGIITTVLSILIPIFLGSVFSPLVPLAFDTLSVLSALLEFTITVPPYTTLYALLNVFTFKLDKMADSVNATVVEDVDFRAVIGKTAHTQYDLRDAMETLVRYGFAVKQYQPSLKILQFKLNQAGLNFIQTCWNETNIKINSEKIELEAVLDSFESRLRKPVELGEKTLNNALTTLRDARDKIRTMYEDYEPLLDVTWGSETSERIDEIEKCVRLLLETKKSERVSLKEK